MSFPPVPVYPLAIDSDRTLFLVYNTAEATLTSNNSPWSQEISIKPVGVDENEIWADNGFANISGELFYYDAVTKDDNGKVNKLKRCARNLGGKKTQFNSTGTWVRGFVVAEHHNQIVQSILNVENFIGINFDERTETLDYRIRNLAALNIGDDDHQCPDVTLDFAITQPSTDGSTGTVVSYNLIIIGFFKNFLLDFGDGNTTTSAQSGTHTYPPNSKIDPIVTVSNDNCQVVQTGIERTNPEEPKMATPEESFFIDIPEIADFPPIVVPQTITPETTLTLPQINFPCELGIGAIGADLPSLIMIEPAIPSIIEFAEIPSFSPIEFGLAPSFSPIEFGAPPSFSPIEFGAPPSFSPIEFGAPPSFSPIDFGPTPSISPIEFGTAPTFGPIEFGTAPTFGPIEFGTAPTFGPIDFGTAPTFSPITFDSPPVIYTDPILFGPAPTFDPIEFGTAPTFSPILFGPAPTFSPILFGPAPTFVTIEFGTAPTFQPIEFGTAPTFQPIEFGTAPTFQPIEFGETPAFDPIEFGTTPTFDPILFGSPPTIGPVLFGPAPAIGPVLFGAAPTVGPVLFGPAPVFSAITFGPAPSFSPIQFGPAPGVSVSWGSAPGVSVSWGTPPACSCTVTVTCPGAMAARAAVADESFVDPFMNIEATTDMLGIPSEINVLVPDIPNISIIHDLPKVITFEIPKFDDIKIIGPEIPLPSEIRIYSDTLIPTSIEVLSDIPSIIKIDASNIPTTLKVEVPKFPTILIDASNIPSTIQVVGMPATLEIKGMPSEIMVVAKEPLEVEMVWKGGMLPIPVQFDFKSPSGMDSDAPCFALVPCGK